MQGKESKCLFFLPALLLTIYSLKETQTKRWLHPIPSLDLKHTSSGVKTYHELFRLFLQVTLSEEAQCSRFYQDTAVLLSGSSQAV